MLDARVLETRAGEDGTEIVIDGVKPERLEQFRSVLDAYKPEAQSMKFIQLYSSHLFNYNVKAL